MGCSGVGYTTETTRSVSWQTGQTMAQRVASAFYNCNDHMMTTMGDVDGYSVVWFTPNRTFTNVNEVCWDVSLANMGNRQWFKVAIVPSGEPELFSDVSASDLPEHGSNTYVYEYNTIGATQRLIVGGRIIGAQYHAGTDKATRYEHCMRDNGNGTITATQDRSTGLLSSTFPGSFPNGTVTVVFHDHNYTPDKSEFAFTRPAYTWHWDNIRIS